MYNVESDKDTCTLLLISQVISPVASCITVNAFLLSSGCIMAQETVFYEFVIAHAPIISTLQCI